MKYFSIAFVAAFALLIAVGAAAQSERNVLIEQYTGTWCGWCPYGHEILSGLKHQYGDDLIALVYHSGDPLEIEDGKKLIEKVKPAYPQAVIDRLQYPGFDKQPISRGAWRPTIEYRSEFPEGLKIDLEGSSYDPDSRTVTVALKMSSRAALEGNYRLNVILTEDHIMEAQKFFAKPYSEIAEFYHSHVVREMFTGAFGEPVEFNETTVSNNNGRDVTEHIFTGSKKYMIGEKYTDDHCSIVVFVHADVDGGYGPVLQAETFSIASLKQAMEGR